MIEKKLQVFRFFYVTPIVLLIAVATINAHANVVVSDPYTNNSFLGLPSLVPGGIDSNTYHVVLYNHGGFGILEGGDPEKVVRKLAEMVFIAYVKKRFGLRSLPHWKKFKTELMSC